VDAIEVNGLPIVSVGAKTVSLLVLGWFDEEGLA